METEIFDDDQQQGNVELKEAINLENVLKGQIFEINYDKLQQEKDDQIVPRDEDIDAFVSVYMDLDSDEENLGSISFEQLDGKMIPVTDDGKIKKRVRREGVGTTPPELSVCSILYSSYLEYNDEPIDYAYIKKPYQFRLGTACFPGINIAVASMKVTEKAQFLFHPEYAFGVMGHPPRIPANATFLFYIELLKFSDSGPALGFDHLSIEDKKEFNKAFKTALGLMESAKEHFRNNPKLAIRDYNRALGLIEECRLKDISEQEEQQKLKLRILINLSVCYNKDNSPKRACTSCNHIFNMVKNTSLHIPAKVYFNNGRALAMIGEYQKAKEKLLRAQRMEPQNTDISKELLKVNEKIHLAKQKDKELALKFISDAQPEMSSTLIQSSVATDDEHEDFRKTVAQSCDELLKNNNLQQYSLPSGLTVEERGIAKVEAEKKGLKFRESKFNENMGKLTFYITKM